MERHDRLMMLTYSSSDEQGRDMELSPSSSIGPTDPHKGDEGRHDPGGLLLPRFSPFLSLSLSVTCAFPFTYKRGSRTPHDEHTAEQAKQDSTPFDLFTRDLGSSPSLARL